MLIAVQLGIDRRAQLDTAAGGGRWAPTMMPSAEQTAEQSEGGARVRRMVLYAVVLPVTIVALLAGGLAWQLDRLLAAAQLSDDAAQIVAQAHLFQKLLLDQETGFRAYLLTRDRAFLESYEKAAPEEPLREIEQSADGNTELIKNLRDLRARYEIWSRNVAAAVAAPANASTIGELRRRKELMDGMRVAVDQIIAHERRLGDARMAASERQTRLTLWLAAAVAAAFLIVLWTFSRRQVRGITSVVEREEAARTAAEDAVRAKDEFLSTLSHELRTPLTPILGWLSLLRANKVDSHGVDHALEVIERNARAEAQIVDDVLDASRIRSGKLRLTMQAMDLWTIVHEAAEALRFAAKAKAITLDLQSDRAALRMVGDPDRLRQIAWNLIGNAIKFTPAGGRVDVSLDLDDSDARLRVSDTGAGIPRDLLPRVFDPFWQADSGNKRAFGGLGLGLALCKYLVDAHGGRIVAASDGLGRGASFTVTLPVAAVAPSEEPASPGAPSTVTVEAAQLDGVHVLIVDDDPGSLEILGALLAAHGADVIQAESGEEALQILGRRRIDVVVSDIAMPNMDGLELIRKIRASRARDVAGMAVSAYAAPQDVSRALQSGFQMHLAKPVSAEGLVGAVRTLAERQRPPTG